MQEVFIPYNHLRELEAYAAYPNGEKRHPAVILCHGWKGRDEFICEQAKKIASWGYVGFALDMYGKGVIGKSKQENLALKMPFLKDRNLLQDRIKTAFEVASGLSFVDCSRIAVLGFGFGGLCALDLARSGAPLLGAISIYGHFDPPPPMLVHPIRCKILVLHGYEDPISPQSELQQFEQEMTCANVDWQLHLYSQTQHAFTNPEANDPAGLFYNPLSAERSWIAVRNFLEELFKNKALAD